MRASHPSSPVAGPRKSVRPWIFAAALILTLLTAAPAAAYIDPGTGSYIVQAVVAAIAGGMFAIKMYWQRLKGLFVRNSSDGSSEAD